MKHLLLPCLALVAPAATAVDRPHILFIMVDEMKWNVTSYAGHPLVKTPHLDQPAREGTQFATSQFAATFNRGTVVREIVENIDVMPTLCEIAGVPLPVAGIQGRSLTPLAAGQTANWKNRAFAERNSSMIRTPQFKYINNRRNNERHGGGKPELYDLVKDPLETNNLATDPGHAATLKELAAQLEQWQRDNPPVPTIAGVALPPTAEKSERAAKATRKAGRKARAEK